MGFWDSLITIGGDIGGAFIGDPMLGNQIEGAKSLFGGGGKGGGPAGISKTSPTFRRAEQLGDLSKEYAFDYALPEGKKLLGEAESTLQKPLDYYSKLLSGNRAEMMAAEAPEMQTIADQIAQGKANISKFTPEGGGQTTLLSELPFQQSRAETELLEKVRPEAARSLQDISKEQGALSGMVTEEGLTAGKTALSAITTQIDALLGKAKLEIPLQEQAGQGMYQILKNMLGGSVSTGQPGDIIPPDPGGNIPSDFPITTGQTPPTPLPPPDVGPAP